MTSFEDAERRIGMHIKSDHPYAYNSGKWATIVSVEQRPDRIVWGLVWPDGKADTWVVDDELGDYKFRDPFQSVEIALRALDTLQEIALAVMWDEMTEGVRAPRELRNELKRLLEDYPRKKAAAEA
jgi:hypothetical protein